MTLDRTNTPSWVQTDLERGKWISYNRYFMDHPEMLMGKMESSRNMYGNEDGTACIAPEGFDLYEHLSDAVEKPVRPFQRGAGCGTDRRSGGRTADRL